MPQAHTSRAVQQRRSGLADALLPPLREAAPASEPRVAALQRAQLDDADGVRRSRVQRAAARGSSHQKEQFSSLSEAAQEGVSGPGAALPHADTIQRSFGKHDVSAVPAHVGGKAATASRAIGAKAYATGGQVAFAKSPDLHLAAHEAAHVVQQRAGVKLSGGVDGGRSDPYEQHADAVADAVVAGKSAEPLLDAPPSGAGASVGRAPAGAAVQREGDENAAAETTSETGEGASASGAGPEPGEAGPEGEGAGPTGDDVAAELAEVIQGQVNEAKGVSAQVEQSGDAVTAVFNVTTAGRDWPKGFGTFEHRVTSFGDVASMYESVLAQIGTLISLEDWASARSALTHRQSPLALGWGTLPEVLKGGQQDAKASQGEWKGKRETEPVVFGRALGRTVAELASDLTDAATTIDAVMTELDGVQKLTFPDGSTRYFNEQEALAFILDKGHVIKMQVLGPLKDQLVLGKQAYASFSGIKASHETAIELAEWWTGVEQPGKRCFETAEYLLGEARRSFESFNNAEGFDARYRGLHLAAQAAKGAGDAIDNALTVVMAWAGTVAGGLEAQRVAVIAIRDLLIATASACFGAVFGPVFASGMNISTVWGGVVASTTAEAVKSFVMEAADAIVNGNEFEVIHIARNTGAAAIGAGISGAVASRLGEYAAKLQLTGLQKALAEGGIDALEGALESTIVDVLMILSGQDVTVDQFMTNVAKGVAIKHFANKQARTAEAAGQ